MKLVKIGIRGMRISASKICRVQMRMHCLSPHKSNCRLHSNLVNGHASTAHSFHGLQLSAFTDSLVWQGPMCADAGYEPWPVRKRVSRDYVWQDLDNKRYVTLSKRVHSTRYRLHATVLMANNDLWLKSYLELIAKLSLLIHTLNDKLLSLLPAVSWV